MVLHGLTGAYMPIVLETTLVLVLVVIAYALVRLLRQLRRTAQGLDDFLQATRKDLAQITEDVHASRLRMDHLGVSIQVHLDELAGFMGAMREVKVGVQSFTGAVRRAFAPASNPFAAIIGGITAVVALFRKDPPKPAP
jgi:hypothetical protein